MGNAIRVCGNRNQGTSQQTDLHQQISQCLCVIDEEQIRDKDHAHHHEQENLCVDWGQGGEKIHIFLSSKLCE
jgi:hypothetical protein